VGGTTITLEDEALYPEAGVCAVLHGVDEEAEGEVHDHCGVSICSHLSVSMSCGALVLGKSSRIT